MRRWRGSLRWSWRLRPDSHPGPARGLRLTCITLRPLFALGSRSDTPLPPLTPPSPRWAMEGDFIWPRVLPVRANMAASCPDLTRFARQVSPHAHLFPLHFPHPSGWAAERRSKRVRSRDCLSRRRVRARPRFYRAPQVARSEAQGPRPSGRLFLCLLSFWRRKKKVSCRRATPGLLAIHRKG